MVSDKDTLWNEAARLCKIWLAAKDDYDNLVQKHYPLKQFPELPLGKDILGNIETARKRADEAHKNFRKARWRLMSK